MASLPPVIERMLQLWNGEPIDPATVYKRGCTENGTTPFEPEEVLLSVTALRTAIPDLAFEVRDWFSSQDRFVLRMGARGTHKGPLDTPLGTAHPTQRAVSISGMEVFRVVDDLIVDVWVGWDFGELYGSMGAEFKSPAD